MVQRLGLATVLLLSGCFGTVGGNGAIDDDDDNGTACRKFVDSVQCGTYDASSSIRCGEYETAECALADYFDCLSQNWSCDPASGKVDTSDWSRCASLATCSGQEDGGSGESTGRTPDDPAVDDGAEVDDGAADGHAEGAEEDDGAADDGAVDDGAVDDGAVDDGAVDDGAADDEGPLDDGGDDAAFLPEPDLGDQTDCSTWLQDCPLGEKCMPYADDGTSTWNATRCSRIDSAPRRRGEACDAENSGVSGIDNCGEGLMCWGVDSDGLDGNCVELCRGSEASPSCSGAGTTCIVSNGGVLPLCLERCDPLLQNCDPGDGCYAIQMEMVCSPDASGEFGGFGEVCANVNGCDPGMVCVAGDTAPFSCASVGCCTAFCDLDVPDCPQGTCTPVYEVGAAPAGLEDVGVCLQ